MLASSWYGYGHHGEARGCSGAFHVLPKVLCALFLVLSKKGVAFASCRSTLTPSQAQAIQGGVRSALLASPKFTQRLWTQEKVELQLYPPRSPCCSSFPGPLFLQHPGYPLATHQCQGSQGQLDHSQTLQGFLFWEVFPHSILNSPCPLALSNAALYKVPRLILFLAAFYPKTKSFQWGQGSACVHGGMSGI